MLQQGKENSGKKMSGKKPSIVTLLNRRLFIRGHNGKVYPYLIVSDSGLTDARREERVLQLLRMMNHLLSKHKVKKIFGDQPNIDSFSNYIQLGNISSIFALHCPPGGCRITTNATCRGQRFLLVAARHLQAVVQHSWG
jgi:hypothetical protein